MSIDLTDNKEVLEEKVITLKCDDDDSRFLAVNKAILAQNSKYFEEFVPSANNVMTLDSKIVSFTTLETLVHFMESGVLTATMDDVESLIYAADYLQIHSAMVNLFEFIMRVIEDHLLSFDMIGKAFLILCLRLYPMMRAYEKMNSCKFEVKAVELTRGERVTGHLNVDLPFVLSYHFKRVINEPLVLKLEESLLRELLLSDYLRISEEEVLRTIKMWVHYDFPARKDSFRRLVRCLRLDDTLTPQFIVEELACTCKDDVAVHCECLNAVRFVVSILAHKLNPKFTDSNGPLIWKERIRLFKFVPITEEDGPK